MRDKQKRPPVRVIGQLIYCFRIICKSTVSLDAAQIRCVFGDNSFFLHSNLSCGYPTEAQY